MFVCAGFLSTLCTPKQFSSYSDKCGCHTLLKHLEGAVRGTGGLHVGHLAMSSKVGLVTFVCVCVLPL